MKPLRHRKVVVKLGTSVLTSGSPRLDKAHMVELVRQMARLRQAGCELILVTSGAIAAGREHLGFPELPDSLASKQMLAAVGQSQLIRTWEQLFNLYGLHVGQILLTRADLDDRERYLNARDTLNALLDNGIIPVINENDAVAIAEIKVGDNDNLSALAAVLAEADQLMLLTDQPGLFDADPRNNPDARLIPEVAHIDDSLRRLAGGSGTTLGTGGMATKLQAADVARRAGVEVVIAAGHAEGIIEGLARGEALGTRFPAMQSALDGRKRWILAGPPPAGSLVLDSGAVNALVNKGSSLLPKGITVIEGQFGRGDTLLLKDGDGQVVGRGICRYAATELERLKGRHSNDIEAELGFSYGPVAIHRNDLVML